MYKLIGPEGEEYQEYNYVSEEDFERVVVDYKDQIFGTEGIYFDIKRRIGKPKKGATTPDGYYLDLKSHENPKLYLVEIEMDTHKVFEHIGQQVLRFVVSSDVTKHKMKKILLDEIAEDQEKAKKLEVFFRESKWEHINELMDKVIFDQDPAVIIVINKITDTLLHMLSKIQTASDVLEVQSFQRDNRLIHRYTPFQEDIIESVSSETDIDDFDTIVVPAREDGFKEAFLEGNCWYQIRISSAMLDKIKYIAAYQVAPISAITHIAEVEKIEKYKDTDKYILYFCSEAKKTGPITLKPGGKVKAPQAPRYTVYSRLVNADSLDDVWAPLK